MEGVDPDKVADYAYRYIVALELDAEELVIAETIYEIHRELWGGENWELNCAITEIVGTRRKRAIAQYIWMWKAHINAPPQYE